LANEQINGNYGVDQLGAGLDEVQRLINYRVHAIPGLDTMGAGAANRYTGQGAAPATGAFTPPAGAVARQYQGKTYYYDPATKQPYPGQ
jgi:hypothetical protein